MERGFVSPIITQDVSVGGTMKVWGGSLFKKVSGIFSGKIEILNQFVPRISKISSENIPHPAVIFLF